MKWLALLALLLLGQDPDVVTLIKQLEDDSAVAREEAAKALFEAGESAVPKLKARMASAEEPLRKTCSQIIERIAIPKKLRGVLPPISRVTIDAKDRSLRDVLLEVQNQTRIPMKLGRADQAARWPKVTVRVENAAPLEALNAICRASKYYWDIPDGGWGGMGYEEPNEAKAGLLEGPEMHFSPGDFDKPRLFVRHYELEIWELVLSRSNDFRKGRSRCELSVGLYWPTGVKPHSALLEVTSLTDDRGKQLLEGPDDPTTSKGWGLELRRWNRYRFRYPDKGTRALASVRGTARLFYLLESKTVTIVAPEKSIGARKEIEGRSAKLVDYKSETGFSKARLRIDGRVSTDPPVVRGRLEGGKVTGPYQCIPVKDASEPLFDFTLYDLQGNLVAIEVVVDTICAEDSFDFEFKDVPLP
jgi:hypothetical protein